MEVEVIENATDRILKEFPEARNNDHLLYVYLCESINPIVCQLSFSTVMRRRDEFQLPKFSSVSRARRKLQERNPALRGDKEVQQCRKELEKEFEAWAVSTAAAE